MELLYSSSMGTASMVLTTLLIYLCFGFIFVGNLQLVAVARNSLRTHHDAFGFFAREMEIYSFTTFMNAMVCLIMQPVIYIVMFASYGLDVFAYAKFMVVLLATLVLERILFAELLFHVRSRMTEERLLLHTALLGLIVTCIVTYYFRSTGL